MQIKYGFRKEFYHFIRTFRMGGILIAVLSFSVADPIMYRMLQYMVEMMEEMGYDYGEVGNLYNEIMTAPMIHSMSMANICSSLLLVIMLILMSPAGGEQKKRATIIPFTGGLEYSGYLVPKFVIYPLFTLAGSIAASLISGALCNLLFVQPIAPQLLVLTALCAGLFNAFIIVVYLTIGLCTSHPAITTVSVFIGISLVQIILNMLGLNDFNPFTLLNLAAGGLYSEDFVLSENIANISVAIALTLLICGLLYLLTYAVLKAKKINNREDKPEF
ncbi:MAG: hypothetical protein ACI4KM_12615 [Oscillospiraceae bacterium]